MTQRFNLPRTDAGVLNAQYKANTGSDGAGSKPAWNKGFRGAYPQTPKRRGLQSCLI